MVKKLNKQAKQTFFDLVIVVLYQKCTLGMMYLPKLHKFQLENSNFKKFSKNYLEIAKIFTFPFKLLVIIGHTSQWILILKYAVVWEKIQLELWIDQICKTCASALNGFRAFSKIAVHHLKWLLLIIIPILIRSDYCP